MIRSAVDARKAAFRLYLETNPSWFVLALGAAHFLQLPCSGSPLPGLNVRVGFHITLSGPVLRSLHAAARMLAKSTK